MQIVKSYSSNQNIEKCIQDMIVDGYKVVSITPYTTFSYGEDTPKGTFYNNTILVVYEKP